MPCTGNYIYTIYIVSSIIISLEMIKKKMCLGYVQSLCHLQKGLEHPQSLVYLGVLESVFCTQMLREDCA